MNRLLFGILVGAILWLTAFGISSLSETGLPTLSSAELGKVSAVGLEKLLKSPASAIMALGAGILLTYGLWRRDGPTKPAAHAGVISKQRMQIAVSICAVAASIFVIGHGKDFGEQAQTYAYSTITFVIGFWLNNGGWKKVYQMCYTEVHFDANSEE